MNEHLTYTAAFEELQTLVAEIEQGTISVDELTQKVKRAAKLIQVCKLKLSATEAEVSQALTVLAEVETLGTKPPGTEL